MGYEDDQDLIVDQAREVRHLQQKNHELEARIETVTSEYDSVMAARNMDADDWDRWSRILRGEVS